MKPAITKIAMIGCSVGALMALLLAMVYAQSESILFIAGAIGIFLMGASYIIQLLFWKCPHCGRALPSRGFWSLTVCPSCKSKL